MPWGKIFSGGSDESSRPILLRFALDGWCRRVLALDPVPRPTGAVGRAEALRHDAFEPELAHTAFPSAPRACVPSCQQTKLDPLTAQVSLNQSRADIFLARLNVAF